VDIQILAVPYDSGHRGERMGAGPEALLKAGLENALKEQGHTVHVKVAEIAAESWHSEIQTGFELMRMLSAAVSTARDAGKFPMILAGNCNTAVGTVAGLGAASTGVAWFDAHGDFNTPETTTSGFLDGTALAILTGRCWRELALTVPRFAPVRDDRICLIGTRELDPVEETLLRESGLEMLSPADAMAMLPGALHSIGEHVEDIYVHLDLDVLDAAAAPANHFASVGGLAVEDVEYALSAIAGAFRITALTLSAYDPGSDPAGTAATAAVRLLCAGAAAAGAS
jgi:arginase